MYEVSSTVSSCTRMKSIRHESWFSSSHLSLEKILEITYLWCEDLSQHTIMKWCQVAEHTIVDWCCFCREVCRVYEADHFEKIGGPGCYVCIIDLCMHTSCYNMIISILCVHSIIEYDYT